MFEEDMDMEGVMEGVMEGDMEGDVEGDRRDWGARYVRAVDFMPRSTK